MATTFPVEVMTPEGAAYEGEVEMIATRSSVGTLGIRANHQPIMTMLETTELRLYVTDKEILRFAQGEGYLQMADNRALLLVEEAIPAAELKIDELQDKLAEAEARLEASKPDTADRQRATRDVKRWTLYLEVAKS